MEIKCATCNNSNKNIEFYGPFCADCAKKKKSEEIDEEVNIDRCSSCNMLLFGKERYNDSKENIEFIISHKIKKPTRIIELYNDKVLLEIIDEFYNKTILLNKEIRIRYNKRLCQVCARKKGGYYEAIIQARGSDEKIDRFINEIKRYLEEREAFITKIENVANGKDLYISDNLLTKSFLHNKGFKTINSYTLKGMQNGKRLYKVTYALYL